MPTYRKHEKLKSRKLIESLFAEGKSFPVFPLKVFYTSIPAEKKQVLQAGVGVSARNFKKAVERNRIKRLLREAYRLNKEDLQLQLVGKQKGLALFFLYIGREIPDHLLLTEKMRAALAKLSEQFS